MSQQDKAKYYSALKSAGVKFERHYREYTEAQLKEEYDKLVPQAPPQQQPPVDAEAAAFFGFQPPPVEPAEVQHPDVPVRSADRDEIAGQRTNTRAEDEPIRIDPDTGHAWYQEEVAKPAYPKPRARRVLKYMDAGVETKTVKNGDYQESFEISGDPRNARESEVKITMPSYQVGIYKDKRFPFKIITYNGAEGFDRDDVNSYYGGAELVPPEVNRKYVQNVLCYDIMSVVGAINAEARRLQLAGRLR